MLLVIILEGWVKSKKKRNVIIILVWRLTLRFAAGDVLTQVISMAMVHPISLQGRYDHDKFNI
jgi:hypothetical protein